MLCGANDSFLMLCESSGCHFPLHCSSSSPSVESSRYPFPLSALCAVPTATACSSYFGSPSMIWASFPTTLMFAATLTLCSTCSVHAPALQSHSTPHRKKVLDRNPRQLTLTCLVPMLPGQCGTMCHQPLPANGWAMSRSSCKLKYSSSHVYDLRGLWEGPLPASWHTCFSPRAEERLPDSESLGVPQALVWGSS